MERKRIEVAIMAGVFVIVAGCFSVPIIIYAIHSQRDHDHATATTRDILYKLDVDSCLQQTNGASMECTYDGSCSRYEGICSAHLKTLRAPNATLMTTMINSHIREQELSEFFAIIEDLSAFVSEKCVSVIMPFLCQYVYPPCDGNGNTKFITQNDCINIRDKMCTSEWRLVMATELRSLLPVCEVLGINDTFIMKGNTSVLSRCHYQFKEFCGVCLPLCGTFSQYPDQIKLREKITILIAAIIAIIGGIIVFFAAVVRRNEMLIFPQVLMMYTTINAVIVAVVVLISYAGGQERLHCSHETLHLSILYPTMFTQITGFVTHFSLLCVAITWFLHLFHFFLGVAFPFWTRWFNESKWKTRLHIMELFGSVILCSLGPIIFVTTSQYTLSRFPPLFALPSKEVTFYTLILPLTIILAIGLDLTVHSFIIIHRNNTLFKREKYHCVMDFSIPEVKILLLLSYFIIVGVVSLVNFSFSTINLNPFFDDLFKYFVCELGGDSSLCADIRQEFETHLMPGLNIITFVLLALLTWVQLLYAIKIQDVKKLIQGIRLHYRAYFKKDNPMTITSTAHT